MLTNYGLERAWGEGVKEIKLEATLNAKSFYLKLGFEVLREIKVERNSVVIDIVEMVLKRGGKIFDEIAYFSNVR